MPDIGAKIAFMPRNRNIRIPVKCNEFRIDWNAGTSMKQTGTNCLTFAGNQPHGWRLGCALAFPAGRRSPLVNGADCDKS
jgi:hypothetical protein